MALGHGFPGVLAYLAALEFTPGGAVAVDDALAGDGDVCFAVGMDGREAAPYVKAFEVGVDYGIKILVRGENDDGIVFQMQLCVAPEADGTGEPDAVRDDEPAAAHGFEFVKGLGESFSVQSDAVSYCTEVSESNRVEGNFGGVYAGHFEG